MVSKKGKGGSDIVIAPLVASGLLATATKLYRDMVEEQKKTRRGGNAEVEAVSKDDLDLFTSKSAEFKQDGGKKRKARKAKRGGFEEEALLEKEAALQTEQEGGKKRKARKAKHGGFEEEALLEKEAALQTEQEGGKKRKARKAKRGGFEEEALLEQEAALQTEQAGGKKRKARKAKRGGFEEEALLEQEAAVQTEQAGGKKRKARKAKRGGEALLEEVSELLQGGKPSKKRSYKKKGGAYEEVPPSQALAGLPLPGVPTPDTFAPGSPVAPGTSPVVSSVQGPASMAGGKAKKHAKKRGGNTDFLGLYESQLSGIATKLNELVRG